MSDWPRIELDPIARLRALSAALPHTLLRECVIDAPFETVWSVVGDLEQGVPRYELGVRSVELLDRVAREDGEHLRLRTHQRLGTANELDAVLRPGWCVMRSARLDIGLAAMPADGDGRRTRFAHYEGARGLGHLLRPLFWLKIGGDFRRIARLVRAGDSEGASG
jgi:hypothetical protein